MTNTASPSRNSRTRRKHGNWTRTKAVKQMDTARRQMRRGLEIHGNCHTEELSEEEYAAWRRTGGVMVYFSMRFAPQVRAIARRLVFENGRETTREDYD